MNNLGFWFLMVGLKLPIFLLFWIIYKAVNDEPLEDDQGSDGPGGSRPPLYPRRGPHGGGRLPAPPRMRTPRAVAQQERKLTKR